MKCKLVKDVLWYKAGTILEKVDGNYYITEADGKRYQTLDSLQMAIADHMDDEGGEKWFEIITSSKSK